MDLNLHPSTKHLYVSPCSPFRKFAEEQPSRHDLYYAVAGGDLDALRSFRPYWNIPICTYRQPGYGEIFTTAQLCLLLQQDRLLNYLLADPFTDVEARSFPSGWTLLMLACAADASLGIISLILQRGSGDKYLNAISASDNTALDCVPRNTNVYLMLRAHGALLARELTPSQLALEGRRVDADSEILSARADHKNNVKKKLREPQQVQPKLRSSSPSHRGITAGSGAEEGKEPVGDKSSLAGRDLEQRQLRAEQGPPQKQRVEKLDRSRHRRSVEGRTQGRRGVKGQKEGKGGSAEKGLQPADRRNLQGRDGLQQPHHDAEGIEKPHFAHQRGATGEERRRRSSKGRKEHPEGSLAEAGGETGITLKGGQGSQKAKDPQEGGRQTKRAHRSRHRRSVERVQVDWSAVEGYTGDAGDEKSVKLEGGEKEARDKGADVEKYVESANRGKMQEARWSQKEGEEHEKPQQSSHEQSAKGEGTPSPWRQEEVDKLWGSASEIARVQENSVREASLRSSSLARSLQGHLCMSPKALSFRSSQLESKSSALADSPVLKPSPRLIEGYLQRHLSTLLNAVSPLSSYAESRNPSPTDSPTLKPLSQHEDGGPRVFADKRTSMHINEIFSVVTPTRSSSSALRARSANLATLVSENNGSSGSSQAGEQSSKHVPQRTSTFVASEEGMTVKSVSPPHMQSRGISYQLTSERASLRSMFPHCDPEALLEGQQPGPRISMHSAKAADTTSLWDKDSKSSKASMPSLLGPGQRHMEEREVSLVGEIAGESKETPDTATKNADVSAEFFSWDEATASNLSVAHSSASMLPKDNPSSIQPRPSHVRATPKFGLLADHVRDKEPYSAEQLSESPEEAHSNDQKSLRSSSRSFGLLSKEMASANSEREISASGSTEAPRRTSTSKPVPARNRLSTRELGFPSPPIGRGASR
ncbi:hypothetical protein Esti_000355 [Eimeria stiedai]